MNLFDFLRITEVRERFSEQFPKPPFTLKSKILAPPQTKNYGLVGTAFDYLLRFYIQKLNPKAIEPTWAAEQSVYVLNKWLLEGRNVEEIRIKAIRVVERAKELHKVYLKTGNITDELILQSIYLAQLDLIYRLGIIDPKIGTADDNDTVDLKNLVSILNPSLFKARHICVLNPTFGEGSRLVKADADLLIDDALIEIKTIKQLELEQIHFNQLLGYYILFLVGGIDLAPDARIEKVGIYFSRYAILHTIPVQYFTAKPEFSTFVEWFKSFAKQVSSS